MLLLSRTLVFDSVPESLGNIADRARRLGVASCVKVPAGGKLTVET